MNLILGCGLSLITYPVLQHLLYHTINQTTLKLISNIDISTLIPFGSFRVCSGEEMRALGGGKEREMFHLI